MQIKETLLQRHDGTLVFSRQAVHILPTQTNTSKSLFAPSSVTNLSTLNNTQGADIEYFDQERKALLETTNTLLNNQLIVIKEEK
jgi:hypothetical protein